MKLNTAFKLSALVVALASTSAFASTLDVAALAPDWESARDTAPSTADRTPDANDINFYDEKGNSKGTLPGLNYQYTDVGSSGIKGDTVEQIEVTNQLTELYRNGEKDKFLVKISPLGSDSAADGITYQFDDSILKDDLKAYLVATGKTVASNDDWLKSVDAKDIAAFFTDRKATDPKYLFTPGNLVAINDPANNQINPEMVFLAGLTKNETGKEADLLDIRRLDSSYLEYAHESKLYIASKDLGGNLTNDNKEQSLVLANTTESKRPDITLEKTSAGVINGILNNKNSNDKEVDVDLDKRIYGLNVHNSYEKYDEEGKKLIASAKDFSQVEASKIQVTSESLDESKNLVTSSTVITSKGITTDKLTVGGVDVGAALGNSAVLGNLTSEQLDVIVNSGTAIQENSDAIAQEVKDRITGDAETLTAANTYTDAKVKEVTGNATAAANAYTDSKTTETLETARVELAAGDAETLKAAQAEDVKTLTAANTYTDASVKASTAGLLDSANAYTDTRANQLNKRVDDVEQTAYRGVAIALAAQQNVPNIKPGQFAVFGGVGHYESESAFAMGVVGAINDRTSVSGALGVAGGSEIGGRVGVAYVFGGK